ncbi:MAG: hypothetical protein QNJ12_09545 [Ilumatobacter sp.]|uniref:hypothetical protein n=1 Tax=Ilumatobacter sp. TaxID=1967498 RepID=UPI002623932E|nr:hypothetical protein [Ilumatobacter sp.]MDJ0769027.1 hypothetical protein [Ilumatobacter sp.]
MPYTLGMGLLWVLLAVLLGIVIGWLLRSVGASRQLARARAATTDNAELERLRGRLANLEPVVAERDRLQSELAEARAGGPGQPASSVAPQPIAAAEGEPQSPPVAPDVDAAKSVLGKSVTLDDLTVVEGVGPKIQELCHGIGIRTWFDLSTTEASLLKTMLVDAGPRFQTHDPSTWPQQAGLLAEGRWAEFKALTDQLAGGRAAE